MRDATLKCFLGSERVTDIFYRFTNMNNLLGLMEKSRAESVLAVNLMHLFITGTSLLD